MSAPAIPSPAEALVAPDQPTRRNVELALLVLVWACGTFGAALASYGVAGTVVAQVWEIAAICGAALLAVHVAVRVLAPYADPVMVPAVAALNLLGIDMILRLDLFRADRAQSAGNPAPSFTSVQQALWLVLGTVACAVVLVVVRDHRILHRYTYTWGLVSLLLLLLPMVPGLGLQIRGARLWIQIGSFTFQPAELAKVTLTIFFASYLVQTRDQLALIRRKVFGLGVPRGRDLGPIVVTWVIAMGIMAMQTDLGTAVMIFGLFVALLYGATGRRSWIVLGFLLTLLGAVLAYNSFGHVRIRFNVWLDPFPRATAEGFQIVQAMFGFASGGITGTGWGRGAPNLVPFADSDFVFSSLGEELGLIGAVAIVVLFAILVQRFLRTAIACWDPFGTLLSVGFAIVLGLQTFLVLGGVTKLIPHTGLTTPFMSAGGSSLLANWILLGIMLRVSDHVRRPDPVLVPRGHLSGDDPLERHSINRLALGLLVLMIAVVAQLTRLQVIQAGELNAMPGNQRTLIRELSRQRGPILADGTELAKSVETTGTLRFRREYPQGEVNASVTGFNSIVFGTTGLERAENDVLAGSDPRLFIDRLQQLFAGRDARGGAVITTLNDRAQQAAFDGLRGKVGSVVAIEPATGRILAQVQMPSFDPTLLSSHSSADANAYYRELEDDPARPLLNRPIARTLPPGSTYKVVTAAAALESGRFTPDSVLPGPATYRLPGSTVQLPNWNNGPCGPGGRVTLRRALEISCNTAFAWLGNELGDDALRSMSERMGFEQNFDTPLRVAASRFPDDPDPAELAQSAIGQFDVRATTLGMAMVAASVANNGVTMRPGIVDQTTAPDLDPLDTFVPTQYARALTPEHARQLADMMVTTVTRGTAGNARIPGVAVAGKTGTAQTSAERRNLAWFVSFAPAVNAKVAVAVCVEEAPSPEVSGNQLAAPIARAVMQAVLAG